MYALVGEVAEKKELEGTESLAELAKKFTVETAVLKENILPGIRSDIKKKVKEQQKKLQKTVELLLQETYLQSEQNNVDDALKAAATEYICAEFGAKYDQISPELFQIERTIEKIVGVEDKQRKTELTIPLLFSAWFGDGDKCSYNEKIKVKGDYGQIECNVTISSKVPPLTKEVREKARQARVDFFEIYAKALKAPGIGHVLMKDLQRFDSKGKLQLRMYWVPDPAELEIKAEVVDKDPFLIAEVYDKKFLVAKWDVEGELPYEHYLREFKL